MPTSNVLTDKLPELHQLFANHPKKKLQWYAEQLGVDCHTTSIGKRKKQWEALLKDDSSPQDFEHPHIPSSNRSVEEILNDQAKAFERSKRHRDASRLQDIKVNIEGPVAIAHFGDPHLDDKGCNVRRFERDLNIVRDTHGLFAGTVGDLTNNWVGRLAAKYADQEVTQSEGFLLVEWMLEYVPWMYVIAGNHDCWSGSRDPIKWIAAHLDQPYTPHRVRMNLLFPKGTPCTIHAAHDFPGNSMWNSNHGATKKAWKYAYDEIFVCGHKHNTCYSTHSHAASGKLQHLLRVDSYKEVDDYTDQLNIDDSFVAPCPVTVINPETEDPAKRINVFLDTQEGADYLGFLRRSLGYN